MQDVNFKYYLRYYDEQTPAWVYYYIDSNGDLADTTTKTELPQAPSGWEQQSLTWERGFIYYGVFTNYSNPLRFVRDGAKILLNLYYNYGVEANCELLIEKLNTTVATWGYEEYYSGDIDFSKLKQIKDYVEVPIMERDFLAEMKAKENSMLEIPVYTNPDAVWVKMDGIDFLYYAKWVGVTSEILKNDTITYFKNPSYMIYTTNGYSRYIVPTSQLVVTGTESANILVNSGDASQDVDLKNDYSYYVDNVTDDGYFGYGYALVSPDSPSVLSAINTFWIFQAPSQLNIGDTATYTGSFSTTITVPDGLALRLFIGMFDATFTNPNVGLSYDVTNLGGELMMDLINRVPVSYIKCVPAKSISESLVANIKSTTTVENTPCDEFEGYLLTSGDAIRGLVDSVMKTSFSDYYEAHNSMFNSAMSYDKANDEVHFLKKYEVFDLAETILDIGEVNNIEVTPLTSEMFSRLKIGYENYSYDEVNGKDEFNTSTEWQSGVKRVTNERNLISPYRADMYGIELLRLNLEQKVTADSGVDNDVFWIHADMSSVAGQIPAGYDGAGEDYYDLYRDSGLTITGLVSPTTAYNIDFSPKRRIYAHGYWIKSATYYPSTTDILTFNTSGKTTNGNVAMETDDGVTIINEKSAVPYSSLPDTDEVSPRSEIFYPIIFTVDTKIPLNIKTIMNNPYREISFRYKGNTYYGWLLSVSDSPSFKPKQTYKLICSPTTDINTLINGI